jgi:dethiobiotin synthetase
MHSRRPRSFFQGGVNSPGAALTPQSELYRPFRLPVVLVGDPKLGGISATLSALESLLIRGYVNLPPSLGLIPGPRPR